MTIYDLNPGDLIKIDINKCFVPSLFEDLKDQFVPINHLKLNDSFPGAVVLWTRKNGREMNYSFGPDDIICAKQADYNDKRWCWIANKIGISDSYTIDKATIAKDDRYKYMWQRWKKDGYYHCPYCDKPLNSQEDIEETFTEVINECDCEGWKAREKLYNNMLKTMKRLENQMKKLLQGTYLDDEIDFSKKDK